MATSSRIGNHTSLSSSIYERRQIQARIRALQQRSNALYEELSRSSSVTRSAVTDIDRAYMKIINEFQEQRDQLLRRLYHVNENIKQSTYQLNSVRKDLNTAQSYRISPMSPRYSMNNEAYEMNAAVDDIEQVLNKIGQQLKEVRFVPSRSHAVGRTLGTIRVNETRRRGTESAVSRISVNQDYLNSTRNISVHKSFTIDLDISGHWVIASLEKRIFVCDNEGEVRVYAHLRQNRRQPLIVEHFHLTTSRLITCFTATKSYLIAFESDTQMLTLHSHHGALLLRFYSPYDPTMFVRCDYKRKNQIWACNRSRRQCYQWHLNHTLKEVTLLDQIDFTVPIGNVLVEPFDISADEKGRVAIHDTNPTTINRLIIYSNEQNTIHSLDFIYDNKPFSSRIERVLLVPKHPYLIVILYTSRPSTSILHEIAVVNIHPPIPEILYHLSEINKIDSIDVTLNSELVYTVSSPANKRTPPKMHIYSLIN